MSRWQGGVTFCTGEGHTRGVPVRAMWAYAATSAESDGAARTFSGGGDSLRVGGREREIRVK